MRDIKTGLGEINFSILHHNVSKYNYVHAGVTGSYVVVARVLEQATARRRAAPEEA